MTLSCTPAATASLQAARARHGVPDTFGIRLFPAEVTEGQVGLGIEFVPGPSEGDQVSEQHGALLFVAPEIAEPLEGMKLDAEPDPVLNGSAPPRFVLRDERT